MIFSANISFGEETNSSSLQPSLRRDLRFDWLQSAVGGLEMERKFPIFCRILAAEFSETPGCMVQPQQFG
jgi:hypothetical protein